MLEKFPSKSIMPDLLHVEIFFIAEKTTARFLIKKWDNFWTRQTRLRQVLRNIFNLILATVVIKNAGPTFSKVLGIGIGSGSYANRFRKGGAT